MNRRSFLRFLGLAPVAVPMVAAAAAAPARLGYATGGWISSDRLAAGEFVMRPSVFGHVLSLPTVEESPRHCVYCVAGHSLEAIEAVRDGGVPLVIDGDDPDRDTLIAAEILPGHARTCLHEGLVRTGGQVVFPLTVDARGDSLVIADVDRRELAGVVREGEESGDWLAELNRQGRVK